MKSLHTLVFPLFLFLVQSSGPKLEISEKSYGAEINCTNYNVYGIQRCIAGINSSILNVTASDTQHADQWCWAASIQGVLNYYGYSISQEEIVYQTWGEIRNMPGKLSDILSALNKSYIDRNGNYFTVVADTFSSNYITAAQDLANNNPLIIGTLGHAMILTALEYNRDQFGNGQITNAVVRDPWPFRPRRRNLSLNEWNNTNLLVRIRVY